MATCQTLSRHTSISASGRSRLCNRAAPWVSCRALHAPTSSRRYFNASILDKAEAVVDEEVEEVVAEEVAARVEEVLRVLSAQRVLYLY